MFRVCVLSAVLSAMFSLGAQAEVPLTLAKKAEVFQADLTRYFVFEGQLAPKMKLPTATRPFIAYNMPDNAYMTGMYVGTLAMQYAATKDPAIKAEASQALKALDLLCTVSGKKGLLARAAIAVDMPFDDDGEWRLSADGKYKWRGDVSSDQMDGVFYGFFMAYDLFADEEEKKVIAKDVSDLMDHLLDNDLRIIGYEGKPTEWGSYYKEYVEKRENMNALLLLQHLKVAAHVTGEARFLAAYEHMAKEEGYARIALTARPPSRPNMNRSNDVLNWLAYYPLLRLEKDPELKALYEDSYQRGWQGAPKAPGIRIEQNPLFAFATNAFFDDASGTAAGVQSLKWFPLDMKWNRLTIAKYEAEFGFRFDPEPKSPAPAKGAIVPLDRRPKQWSVWVHSPYEEMGRGADSEMEYNSLDYLMAYWLGRYHGYITEDM
jgi:hypothetical protein